MPPEGAELWAVVKADGYGHGAVDVSRAALEAGATALCVATLPEALELRAALAERAHPRHGPGRPTARSARREAAGSSSSLPTVACRRDVRVHLKLDTGMGRWGLAELPSPTRDVVGVMSHLASAESDPAFTQLQIERFREATAGLGTAHAPHREQRGDSPLSRKRGSTRFAAESRSTGSRRSAPIPARTGSSPRCAGSRTSPS